MHINNYTHPMDKKLSEYLYTNPEIHKQIV